MQYRKDRNGNPISVIGYGCMRFTKNGSNIDFDKAEKEIMRGIANGINYYDTAYMYSGSEECLGRILEKNNCRDKVKIATKLPQYIVKNASQIDKYFDEELRRLRTDYIDYYLMHMFTDLSNWENLKNLGIVDWIARKKESGAIKNIGFSYHGDTEMFLKILNAYDWDFCQIQYNYVDEHTQAGRRGLEAAAEKGIPVVIMEPLRGGKLVNLLCEFVRKLLSLFLAELEVVLCELAALFHCLELFDGITSYVSYLNLCVLGNFLNVLYDLLTSVLCERREYKTDKLSVVHGVDSDIRLLDRLLDLSEN